MVTFLGIDVGTSSTKGVLVDESGTVLAQAVREHSVSRPDAGRVEIDGRLWWDEFVSIAAELTDRASEPPSAIGISGMGPCVLLTDADDQPVAPAALYGVDTRATAEIEQLNDELGADAIFETCDSYLSTQSAGPKLRWFANHMPEAYAAARRFHMPASYIVARLTGEYVLDRQSASQSTPLYDATTQEWHTAWTDVVAPGITLPRLAWAGDVAGSVTRAAAEAVPGLHPDTPVVVGTIDAWAEGLSVSAVSAGDLMLMYGTTLFLIGTTEHRVRHPSMWGTTGLSAGEWNLAGGMATSGAITGWLRDLFGSPSYTDLVAEAGESGPGSRGLVMLPYFEGERTPIQDPHARGTVTGLTISHTRGDLYRAALEATAFGVRHNIETFREAGVDVSRVVAVGGGTQSSLWPQIVSDVIGLPQEIRQVTVGASYGDAFLAARAAGLDVDIATWNPVTATVEPNTHQVYEDHYGHYRDLYAQTHHIQHALARESSGDRA
ncbi:xylulokinase [Georgenia soli]|uniref:Xylulokinase n=1 Tax=Georgenia soli TaxID=638953 RepID=A0A2A9ES34_9MICO|nr:FGGY-family carbohydrate kinase [Georgenia soli]PFG41055.1 xylulokinase [Georgenia soli]